MKCYVYVVGGTLSNGDKEPQLVDSFAVDFFSGETLAEKKATILRMAKAGIAFDYYRKYMVICFAQDCFGDVQILGSYGWHTKNKRRSWRLNVPPCEFY